LIVGNDRVTRASPDHLQRFVRVLRADSRKAGASETARHQLDLIEFVVQHTKWKIFAVSFGDLHFGVWHDAQPIGTASARATLTANLGFRSIEPALEIDPASYKRLKT
jgi:hypothetical protein